MLSWLIVSALLLTVAGVNSETNKIVCYFGSWAGYRTGNGNFDVETIQPNLCTHLIYSFVGINSDGSIKILDAWNDLPEGKDAMNRFTNLRSRSPGTKVLVSVGGWNEGSTGFSQVVNNAGKRAAFVTNVVNFLQQHGFNGLDIDWEYPAQRGGAASDKTALVKLTQELRQEFNKHGLLLTAAVGADPGLLSTSYDAKELSKNLDIINLMAYAFHGGWESTTGENAPLYGGNYNVDACIQYWIENGASPDKIALGMGTYGITYTLENNDSAGLGVAVTGAGTAGPYTASAGTLGYNEICENIKNGGWKVTWDDTEKVPYAVSGNQWVGYDNVDSIKMKAQYAKDHGLGGAMIWSIETDDFRGICHDKKFPLLSAINEVFQTGQTGEQ